MIQAAAEAEAATLSIAKRAIPEATSIEEANQIVRGNWMNAIEEHHLKYSGHRQINDILDIGCSVGVSTRYLADRFPSAKAVVRAQTFSGTLYSPQVSKSLFDLYNLGLQCWNSYWISRTNFFTGTELGTVIQSKI